MVLRNSFRSPRPVLVLFLGTTLVLLAGLGWLGSRSLERDRAVEVQRIRDRLESATDLIAAELRQNLASIEEELTRMSLLPAPAVQEAALEYGQTLAQDSVIVVFASEAVGAYPSQRLLHYPALPAPEEPETQPFKTGESLEFRDRDFAGAIAYFQQLARAYESGDEMIRAGALLRLARNQRKAGLLDAALATYRELGAAGPVSVSGWPAELVALRARCDLLERLGRDAELRVEAQGLEADLYGGRWPLTRSAYLHFTAEVEEWRARQSASLSQSSAATPVALSLAAGVETVWEEWLAERQTASVLSGRRSLASHEQSLFLLWRGTPNQLVALVAGKAFLEQRVVAPLHDLMERQGIAIVLADGEGNTVVSSHDSGGGNVQRVVRTMSDTRLPWTLRVASTDTKADLAQVTTRSRLLFAGLAFLALLAIAVSYFSARAISREIEVAHLQSDFVAAVSHEFRTPLTTLRQFTDLLADGRITSQEERDKCYAALRRGTRRLNHLVENLLDFGRMEAGFHGFIPEPLPAKEWVERVVSEFQQEVQERGYRVELDWHTSGGVRLKADEAALERALWNLLDNAVKYSPDCKTVRVQGDVDGDDLIVSVRDRGIGVPVEEQREIFRKFVRGAEQKGHAVKGTGLGLALVDQIVRAHGGKVKVESKVGEGSTFSLLLPVQR